MEMNKKTLQRINFISIILSLYCAFASNIRDIQENKNYELNISNKTGGKNYYKIHLQTQQDGMDLVIQLYRRTNDPDLKVYLNLESHETSKENYFCSSNDSIQDVCIIQSDHILLNQFILIEVTCSTYCKYSLNSHYKEKIKISQKIHGKIHSFYSPNANILEQFEIQIPENSKDLYLVIQAKQFFFNSYAPIDMFGSYKSLPFRNRNEAKFKSKWNSPNNLEIFIESEDIYSLCQVIIILSAQFEDNILFSVEYHKQERSIHLTEKINDNIKTNETKFFKLDFSQQEENLKFDKTRFNSDFEFQLQNQLGNLDLYIHCGNQKPHSLEQFYWKFLQIHELSNQFLIDSDSFNSKTCSIENNIFIAIYANLASKFILSVKDYNKKSQIHFLNPKISGYVEKGKSQNFFKRHKRNIKTNIEFILTRKLGSPDLFIKGVKSTFKNQKFILLEEIEKFKISQQTITSPFLAFSANNLRVDTRRMELNPTSCKDKYIQQEDEDVEIEIFQELECIYNFSIFGNEQTNYYELEIIQSQRSFVTPLKQEIQEHFKNDERSEKILVFQPENPKSDIQKISFEIEHQLGFVTISADRKLSQIFKNNPEKNSSNSKSCIVEYYASEHLESNLAKSQYFIQVQGFQTSVVFISVNVYNKLEQQIEYQTLRLGFPKKFLIPENPVQHLMLRLEQDSNMKISAQVSNGSIEMFLGEQKPPSKESHDFEAKDALAYSSNIKQVLFSSSLISCAQNVCFLSIWNLSNHIVGVEVNYFSGSYKFIQKNKIENEIINEGKLNSFFQRLFLKDLSQKINLIISSKNENGYFFQDTKIKYLINSMTVKEIYLTSKEKHIIIQIQHEDHLDKFILPFDYGIFGIQITTRYSQPVSIFLNQPSLSTTLLDYEDAESQFPFKGEIRKFHYLLLKQNEVILSVSSDSYPLIILGKVYKLDSFYDKNLSYPQSIQDQTLSFAAEAQKNHLIRVSPETFDKVACFDCFIAISVILGDDQIDEKSLIDKSFKIGMNGSAIKNLRNGKVEQDYVYKGRMIFYNISVTSENYNEKMLVTLTSLGNGNPDLFLNLGSKLPTQKESDFSSRDDEGDFIQVDNRIIYSLKQDKMEDYYLVGVIGFGSTLSAFKICFSFVKSGIQKIQLNEMQEITLNQGSTQYFVFDKRDQGSLAVISSVRQGNANDMIIFIKEFPNKNYQDILHKLIDSNESDQTTQISNHKEQLIYEKSKCDHCVYLIGVKSTTAISLAFQVKVQEEILLLPNNKKLQISLLSNKVFKLQFQSRENFIFSVASRQCIEVKIFSKSIKLKNSLIQSTQCFEQENLSNSQNLQILKDEIINAEKDGEELWIFEVELLAGKDEEKLFVYGVTGTNLKLIQEQKQISTQISSINPIVEFKYFSSIEPWQSIQINLLLDGEQREILEQLSVSIEETETSTIIEDLATAMTPSVKSYSFRTQQSKPYTLKIRSNAFRTIYLKIFLKEQSTRISVLQKDSPAFSDLATGQFQNYQINRKPDHKLLIENFNCENQQSIYFYENIEDLIAKDHNLLPDKNENSNHDLFIFNSGESNESKLFLQKAADRDNYQLKSVSRIKFTEFSRNQLIIYDYFKIGGKGMVDYSYNNDKFDIKVSNFECIKVDCLEMKLLINEIEYQLHASDNNQKLASIINCEANENDNLKINSKNLILKGQETLWNNEQRIISFDKSDIPEINQIFVSISVKVKVDYLDENLQIAPLYFRYIYGTTIINIKTNETNDTNDTDSFLPYIGAFSIFAIGSIATYKLLKQDGSKRKKQEVEMADREEDEQNHNIIDN